MDKIEKLAEEAIPAHPYPDMTYPATAVDKIKRQCWAEGYKAATQQPIELKEDWISVEDGLPDKDKLYLTFTKSPRTSSIGINMFDSEMKQFPSSFTTHWKELPEPPQTKG